MSWADGTGAAADAIASAVNEECRKRGGVYAQYSCKSVSWDDVSRGTVGGALSCWGGNITDTRLYAKDGASLYTCRSDNWCARDGWGGACPFPADKKISPGISGNILTNGETGMGP